MTTRTQLAAMPERLRAETLLVMPEAELRGCLPLGHRFFAKRISVDSLVDFVRRECPQVKHLLQLEYGDQHGRLRAMRAAIWNGIRNELALAPKPKTQEAADLSGEVENS